MVPKVAGRSMNGIIGNFCDFCNRFKAFDIENHQKK